MLNPWLLAAAVFGLIGLLDESKSVDGKKPKVLPAPKKEPDTKASQTIVNVGTGVKSEKEPKQKPKKPSAKVPTEPSGDG